MYYLANAHRKTKTNECFLPNLARQSPHKAFYWYLTSYVLWYQSASVMRNAKSFGHAYGSTDHSEIHVRDHIQVNNNIAPS